MATKKSTSAVTAPIDEVKVKDTVKDSEKIEAVSDVAPEEADSTQALASRADDFVGEPVSKSDAVEAEAVSSSTDAAPVSTRPVRGYSNNNGPRRTSLSRPATRSYGGHSRSRVHMPFEAQGKLRDNDMSYPSQSRSFASSDRNRDMQGDDFSSPNTPTEEVKGFLDIQPEGHGFLRPKFIPSSRDIYISQSQIRRFSLRAGDMVEGVARPPKDTERYYGLLKVERVNEVSADDSLKRPYFDDLTPIYPKQQVILATGKTPFSTRIIDLVAPIGFGQRGMIVSPPKAGKTTILKEIAAGISQNFPKVHLMAALIGERPEEVTDISMSVKGEVVASNFDEPPENQTKVAEITLDRARRMVEMGKDVVVLLDSITRLARAYNLSVAPSGRTLSGGFDPAALWPAKKFFGAARNCEEGGSLTIIGTALVETGSRMDDLIYEEFKGTGNMELHLDRRLAERRIFPSINVERSGTRQEELILSETTYKRIVTLRRMIDMMGPDERTAILIEKLSQTETNEAFLETLGKS